MQLSSRLAFIGSGNMASALISGILAARTCARESIIASDAQADTLSGLARSHGIATTLDNCEAVRDADVIVLSTKPQVLPAVLAQLGPVIPPRALLISIAAGVPLIAIERAFPRGTRAVRAMPNTPALVRAGATAIAAGSAASPADMEIAQAIFESVGIVEQVPEALMDAVTGLSGSGPAYVFLLVEALTGAGIRVGLPAASAARLAEQTVFGAGKLLHESGESPEALRRKVTSPAGTTAAGIAQLEQRDFAGVVADAVRRATERATELGTEAGRIP
jgi:pyrroline-5-carboxylate reductase